MSQINYLFWKTGQGVNFGSCEDGYHRFRHKGEQILVIDLIKMKLEAAGYKCEIEAETPELRAEQLRRIANDKRIE